jgi:hypothetical protein
MDVNYQATKRHYAELFERYSYPLLCLNLTKAKNNRECLVSDEYNYVINEVINQQLPKPLRISYIHYDMKIRKKEPDFPKSIHETVKPFIKKMGIFFCSRN